MYCGKCGKKVILFCDRVGIDENKKPIYKKYQQCKKCNEIKEVPLDYPPPKQSIQSEFTGIYKYTLLGKKEVYCPRCKSWDCRRDSRNVFIPGKTKITYSVNLNPLKPFTFANKNEKVIRQDMNFEQEFFVCNKCGKKFY